MKLECLYPDEGGTPYACRLGSASRQALAPQGLKDAVAALVRPIDLEELAPGQTARSGGSAGPFATLVRT